MKATSAVDLDDLLARCGLKDRQAFALLYDNTSAKLFAVVLRILKQQSLAEETLQDVYLKIWQRAGDYRSGRVQAMTWLISIARNRAIDVLRSQGRHQAVDNPDNLDHLTDDAPGPQQQAMRSRQQEELDRCMEQLPPPRRQCLQLAYCEGYTHDELSTRLKTPVGTIKSWIRRSLLAVRDCLEALHD